MNTDQELDRKVKAWLNKLTMRNFRSIAEQITSLVNESEDESDGRTLRRVIQLVLDQAINDASSAERYARLYRWITEHISPQIQDGRITDEEGKAATGGELCRKYLLSLCQKRLERGWIINEPGDDAFRSATEPRGSESRETKHPLDKLHAPERTKSHIVDLIKVIGELFKLQNLPECIVHECVRKLLANAESHNEEEIKSLCALLTSVGSNLDTPESRSEMDIYFCQFAELTTIASVSLRLRFMLQVRPASECPSNYRFIVFLRMS